jgi:hypothetical protein
VEYRTVGDFVFVRNPTRDPDRLISFTVAEWDAFVAGLTAEVATENQRLKALVGDETYEAETWEGCDRAEAIRQANSFHEAAMNWTVEHDKRRDERDEAEAVRREVEIDRDNLAAQNARLRQRVDTLEKSLTAADCEVESLRTFADEVLDLVPEGWGDEMPLPPLPADGSLPPLVSNETVALGWVRRIAAENPRLRRQHDQAAKDLAKVVRERDALVGGIAEAVRHRNEAIAEAAVLGSKVRRMQPVVEAAEAWLAVAAVTPAPWWWQPDRTVHALTAAVDAFQNGPQTAPASPLPAEQPPVEVLATDGAGAQGEAQGAAEASWTAAIERIRSEAGDLTRKMFAAELKLRPDNERTPRVWNAGDPEPEGVERVKDADGDTWKRRRPDRGGWWRQVGGHLNQHWGSLTPPLTEVLPELAPVTIAEGIQVALDGLRAQEKRRADLADREAGRAGEAQNRTEGLDAPIEAASRATVRHTLIRCSTGRTAEDGPIEPYRWLCSCGQTGSDNFTLHVTAEAVRAASPLIERAALLAAADDWMVDWLAEGTGFPENTDAWLKKRAGRVVGS